MATGAPDPAAQKARIKGLMDTDGGEIRAGTEWCPINFKWWEVWQAYVGYNDEDASGSPPGAIDNSSLSGPITGTLKTALAEHYDYELLPKRVWDTLASWYGGGPEFKRGVVVRGGYQTSVELFPQPCKSLRVTDDGSPGSDEKVVLAPRSALGSKVVQMTAAAFGESAAQSRLWVKVGGSSVYQLLNPESKVEEFAGNDPHTDLLLDVKKTDGSWTRPDPEFAAGTTESGVDLAAWRASLKTGDKLDACDHERKWYESVVVDVKAPDEELVLEGTQHDIEGEGDRLKVHFKGWASKWDSWYCRSSDKLLPLHTKVRNWRDFRANDKIEMKHKNRWHMAKVEEVDRDGKRVKLRPVEAKERQLVGDKWFDFDSDDLADAYTHIKKRYTSYSNYSSYRSHTRGTPPEAGVVGLNNLGNTCFMNSMLQCLSNTQALTEYFVSDSYKDEINKDNVLGCGGHLAEAYGQLMKDMWGGENVIVCPTDFKTQIGNKAPQFQGYQQQDSQELMSFLMDGLHEDLNRILKKPYVEDVESNGRPDSVVSTEAWAAYLKRNDSIVADIFAGQLKSHVTCNICDRESVTFDPFMSLSVPIPVKNEKYLIFTFMPYDGKPPMRYKALVPKQGAVADLIAWAAEAMGLPATELIVGDVYLWKVFRFLPNQRALSDIRDNDIIWMYHVPEAPGAADVKAARVKAWDEAAAKRRAGGTSRTFYGRPLDPPAENEQDVMVLMMRAEKPVAHHNPHYGGAAARLEGAADPHLVCLPHTAGSYEAPPSGKAVHETVFQQLERFIKPAVRGDYSAASPPYTLNLIPKSGHGAKEVEFTDEPLQLGKDQMLAADWTSDSFAATFEVEQVTHCEFHDSTQANMGKAEAMTLAQCFERFNVKEQLSADDMWYCSKCKEHRRAYKRMALYKAPDILIVHLKRFQYSQGVFFVHRDKIDALIDFPLEGFDLTPMLPEGADPAVYDLFAVSNHAGGLGGGHYTAYGKNFKDDSWYDFNDSHVSKADPARIVSRQAYVLFYQKRGSVGPAGK